MNDVKYAPNKRENDATVFIDGCRSQIAQARLFLQTGLREEARKLHDLAARKYINFCEFDMINPQGEDARAVRKGLDELHGNIYGGKK